MNGKLRVFLLDDHEVVRRGVRQLLEAETDLAVVGEAATAADALSRAPGAHPDVAVLDIRLPDGNGIEVCRELRSIMPGLACLMLTSFADDEALLASVMAGASGYVLKEIGGADLVAAVRTVAVGGSLLDAQATSVVLERLRDNRNDEPFAVLSAQERRVLELIAEGLTNRQIGEQMSLAEKTVKNYVSALLVKLGLQRRTQAAVMATEARRPGSARWDFRLFPTGVRTPDSRGMTPYLEVLSRSECLRLLRTVPLGRLIYTHHAMPAVVPVNFLLDGTEILVRAGYGGALAAAIRGSVVAFEADSFDLEVHSGWSVAVTGLAREEMDSVELARLMTLPLRPWAPGPRDHFLKIPADIVTGRRLVERVPAEV